MIWALRHIIKILGLRGSEHNISMQNSQPLTLNAGRFVPDQSTIRNLQSDYNGFRLVKTPINIPIVLFIGLVIFQLVPLPSVILNSISPNTYFLYRMTLPGWPEDKFNHMKSAIRNPQSEVVNQHSTDQIPAPARAVADELQSRTDNSETRSLQLATRRPDAEVSDTKSSIVNRQSSIWRSLTIYHYATKSELIKILAYIGMFFLITNTHGLRIKRIVVVIISVGFCISLLGILQKLTGTTDIYWIKDASYATHFGPYVNRNHFAGYIGMTIPLALGLLVSRFAGVAFSKNGDRHSILAEFQSHFFANLLLIFVIVIMLTALFLSLSRGGIMSFAVAVVAFCTLIGFTRLRAIMGRGWRIMTSVLVITFIFLMWLGLDPILNRLSDISSPARYEVYENTINMAKDFPVFGTGIGTFQYIYQMYKTSQGQLYYDHAHNDYLELISDCGLVGFVIVLSGFIMFFWKTLARWWERRHHYAKGVTMGGVCGIIAILAHSFTDFNLHIPANALFLSIILGLTHTTVNLKRIDN